MRRWAVFRDAPTMSVIPNLASTDDRPPMHVDREAVLLQLIARVDLDENQKTRLRELAASGPDWTRIVELAKAHGLRPLLFRHLEGALGQVLPRAVLASLWIHQEQLRAKNLRMRDELLEIVRLLEHEGIPVLPLKGPMLALQAYKDLSLREFGDLDLLVPIEHRARARQLLAERGYASFFPISADAEAALLRSPVHYHIALKRELMVELHWKTDAEFPLEPLGGAEWWKTLGRVRVGDIDVRILAPHEQVLALCLHGSKHHWSSLHWLVDIAELLALHRDIDWDWVLARAGELRANRRLALGLLMLRDNMDCRFPGQVEAWLATQETVRSLASDIAIGWFELRPEPMGAWQRLRRNLSLYETTAARLKHIANVSLRPTVAEWSRWPLPKPLFFLYLPLRGWRLLTKLLRR